MGKLNHPLSENHPLFSSSYSRHGLAGLFELHIFIEESSSRVVSATPGANIEMKICISRVTGKSMNFHTRWKMRRSSESSCRLCALVSSCFFAVVIMTEVGVWKNSADGDQSVCEGFFYFRL